MPQNKILPLVLCLFLNRERILVSRSYDSVKCEYYYRPLGGGIEFGETSREAVTREMREELGAVIENVKLIGMLENIFINEGEPGHEIVLVYDATFVDRSLYERDVLNAHEPELGSSFIAEWKSLDDLQRGPDRLVPEGLAALILGLSNEQ